MAWAIIGHLRRQLAEGPAIWREGWSIFPIAMVKPKEAIARELFIAFRSVLFFPAFTRCLHSFSILNTIMFVLEFLSTCCRLIDRRRLLVVGQNMRKAIWNLAKRDKSSRSSPDSRLLTLWTPSFHQELPYRCQEHGRQRDGATILVASHAISVLSRRPSCRQSI
jgi:hypothetical protein